MWRFYVRYIDGNIGTMTAVSRANWTACNTVYNRVSSEWRDVLRTVYAADPMTMIATIEAYCAAHSMTPASVWKIVHAAQVSACKERGLIDPEWIPRPRDSVIHYADRKTGFDPSHLSDRTEQTGHVNQTEE